MTAVLAAVLLASTNYSPCSSGTIMADGTPVRFGSVAMNTLPLGTRVYLRPGLYGRHRFVVRDRIGWGSQLDIWNPSCAGAIAYGRRTQRLTVGWPQRRGKVLRRVKARIPWGAHV